MATGKVVGQIQVTEGDIKIIGVEGAVREPEFEGFLYENEQVISNDPNALFQIKFLALPEASAYDGIFRILADGSVIHGRDAMDSIASDENLVDILETAAAEEVKEVEDLETAAGEDLETAAGEEGAEGSSVFTETDIVADSSVLGFSRGGNSELGYGIVDFGTTLNLDNLQIAPPAITSPNVVIYDENDTIPVTQVTAESQVDVSFSISGLDSDLFNIDSATGVITFKESPDFENPKDLGGDNEYNIYVTATDTVGNFTTQLLSVSINNVNEAVTAVDDTANAVEDTILSSTIDLDANDYDIDGDDLSVVAGTFATAQGGEIVIAADGSYTYTPAANFNGVDSVEYTVTDGEFSDVGTLTINVAPVNDAPVAVDDAVDAVEDTVLSSVIDLDANDYDIDGDDLSVVAGTFATAKGGELVLASDGSYTYTPAVDFNGIDSVDYTVTDGELSDVGTLTINVAAVDDILPPPPPPPVDENDAPIVSVDSGDPKSVSESGLPTGTDAEADTEFAYGTFTLSDADGLDDIDSVTINGTPILIGSLVGSSVDSDIGTLTVTDYNSDTGVATYEYKLRFPTTDIDGEAEQDIFTLTANDGTVDSEVATITIDIVDDIPIISSANVVGPVGDLTFSGVLDLSSGADIPSDISIVLNSLTVGGGVVAETKFNDDYTYDNLSKTGVGSGSYIYDGKEYEFTFTLSDDNTYTLELASAPVIVNVEPGDYVGASIISGSGPTAVYEMTYTDGFTATVDAIDTGTAIELVNIDGTTNYTAYAVADSFNVSSSGIGMDNGNLQSYYDDGVYKTESLTYNPGEDNVSSITTYFGANKFGGGQEDVLYMRIDGKIGTADVSQTILLGSAYGDFIVGYGTEPTLTPIEGGYEGGVLSSYTVNLPDGWSTIDSMQVTAGFDGTDTTSVKVNFGFSTSIITSVDQEVMMDFTATVTDVDGDTDTVDFMVVADKADIVEDGVITGTAGDDYIAGTAGDDEIDGGAGDDYIDGGAGADALYGGAGNDTIEYDALDTEIDGGTGFDTLIGNSEVINLANVSNMEVIELNSGTSVIGSGIDLGINAADVLSASDSGTLYIQSADGSSLNQVNIDTDSLVLQAGSVNIDGINYAQYTGDGATLLIELDDPIEVI